MSAMAMTSDADICSSTAYMGEVPVAGILVWFQPVLKHEHQIQGMRDSSSVQEPAMLSRCHTGATVCVLTVWLIAIL